MIVYKNYVGKHTHYEVSLILTLFGFWTGSFEIV